MKTEDEIKTYRESFIEKLKTETLSDEQSAFEKGFLLGLAWVLGEAGDQ